MDQLIVSGGGARNPLLLAQLSAALSPVPPGLDASAQRAPRFPIEVIRSTSFGIPTDAKEAFAFALLAYETFHRRSTNLPSATGAQKPAILGKISYAPPR
jgi:anhydro-N-acetylmuramic acid kinase